MQSHRNREKIAIRNGWKAGEYLNLLHLIILLLRDCRHIERWVSVSGTHNLSSPSAFLWRKKVNSLTLFEWLPCYSDRPPSSRTVSLNATLRVIFAIILFSQINAYGAAKNTSDTLIYAQTIIASNMRCMCIPSGTILFTRPCVYCNT